MNKVAYEYGRLAANAALGAGLGGWAGAAMSPENKKLQGLLEGALAGSGVGVLKNHLLAEILAKKTSINPAILEMLPLATVAGGIKGSQIPKDKRWWK